jgi:Ca2+-binding RTX toxin-like protein
VITAGNSGSYIKDHGGADRYIGGNDGDDNPWNNRDTVTYSEWFWNPKGVISGIHADIKKGKIIGPDGFTDTIKNIEEIRGTFLKDTMLGDGTENWFNGLQGNDLLNGRGGSDTVSYHKDARHGGTDGVKVNLKEGFARDGFGNTDKLKSIEGAKGTDTQDVFVGNDKPNWFDGRDGDDVFRLYKGNDNVRGGDGDDRFVFYGSSFGENIIRDFDDGDKIKIRNAGSFSDLKIKTSSDGDALIKFAGNSIELDGVGKSDVSADDFIF